MTKPDASFLAPFLVEPSLLSWDAAPDSDFAKKLKWVFLALRDTPFLLREEEVKSIVWDPKSQIGNKDAYWGHIVNVAGIYSQMVEMLGEKVSGLDLPNPEVARARGLIHDIDSTYAKYGGEFKGKKFAQHDKQLTEYFHFRHLGLAELAKQVPMHCSYLEVLEMIAQGKGFPEVGMYEDWTKALNEPANPLNIQAIRQDFNSFMQGKENLPLMALAVADYVDNGKPSFSLETLDQDFATRRDDILKRYYYGKIADKKTPPALGIALVEKGGVKRIQNYFEIVKGLLSGRADEYRQTHPKLWTPEQIGAK